MTAIGDIREMYEIDPERCLRELNASRGRSRLTADGSDEEHTNDGPVTLRAIAAAYYRGYWRTLAALLARAPDDVRAQYACLCPDEGPESDIALGRGWTVSIGPGPTPSEVVYVANECRHGRGVAHSLEEALDCGMLAAVRAARGLSQQAAAAQIGCSVGAIRRWDAGTRSPTGKYRQALEAWLSGGPEERGGAGPEG